MRTYVLLAWMVLGTCSVAEAQPIPQDQGPWPLTDIVDLYSPFPEPELGSVEWFEQRHWGPRVSGGALPDLRFTTAEITTPMRVSITPRSPTPSDEVIATISGWTSSSESYLYRVDHTDLRIEDHDILLDLYWVRVVPPLVSQMQGGFALQSATEQVPLGQGPLQRNAYEVTKSLGTFDAGTYKVYVTNHGPIEGGASASFTVRDSGFNVTRGERGLPWWWTPVRWIDPRSLEYVGAPLRVTDGL